MIKKSKRDDRIWWIILYTYILFLIIIITDTNTTLSSTCNVYECPEFHSFLLLDRMSVYDYYSLFSKPLREYIKYGIDTFIYVT